MLLLSVSADLVRHTASGTTRASVAGWVGSDRQAVFVVDQGKVPTRRHVCRLLDKPGACSPNFIEPVGKGWKCVSPLPVCTWMRSEAITAVFASSSKRGRRRLREAHRPRRRSGLRAEDRMGTCLRRRGVDGGSAAGSSPAIDRARVRPQHDVVVIRQTHQPWYA